METGISIGSKAMKEAAEPLADALFKIMSANAEQETIRKALEVFGRTVAVENVTIQGANIDARTINIEGLATEAAS